MTGTTRRQVLDDTAQDLLLRQAFTADRLTGEPVDADTGPAVHDPVRDAPTAVDRQPLGPCPLRSAGSREPGAGSRARPALHLSRSNREKTLEAPFTAPLAVDSEFHRGLPQQFPQFPGAMDLFTCDRAVGERSALPNGALQAAYFLIGARARGLPPDR